MKPTDEELEAMAARLDKGDPFGGVMQRAAAMLRACKGRVKRLPRADGEGGWTLPVELLAEIRDEVYANEWDAPCAEVIEIIALSAETRILAALEPAPDARQEWWRAGMLDAAQVALDCIYYDSAGIGFDEDKFDDAIRVLAEKGPVHE